MKRIKAIALLLFSFRGRISLPMWWFGKLLWFVYVFVLLLPVVLLAELGKVFSSEDLVGGIAGLFWILSWVWSSTVLNIKRFHDRNMSGSFVVVGLVPVVGFIFNFVHLGVLSGDLEDNLYGSPPPQSPKEWWQSYGQFRESTIKE